jgi:hypothetical protein
MAQAERLRNCVSATGNGMILYSPQVPDQLQGMSSHVSKGNQDRQVAKVMPRLLDTQESTQVGTELECMNPRSGLEVLENR